MNTSLCIRKSALLFLGTVACQGGGKATTAGSQPVSKVEHPVAEAQLTTLTLSAAGLARLRLETAVVESSTVVASREFGGEVIPPPGTSFRVTTPVAGIVVPPQGAEIPQAGARLADKQVILRIVPLPPDQSLARTAQEKVVAEARLTEMQAEARRVAALFADRLVSARENEKAQADLVAAQQAVNAIRAQEALARGDATSSAATATALSVTVPEAGVLMSLTASPGQIVSAGEPIAEVVNLDRLWIKVSVYAGDLAQLTRTAAAEARTLGGSTSTSVSATPVSSPPPSANASSASVDLYYDVRGNPGPFRPGERVAVAIPMRGALERAINVPSSAIVYDANGGSWVYEQMDSLKFTRHLVDVKRVFGRRAVISRGLQPGMKIVITGVAELFGAEFGIGK